MDKAEHQWRSKGNQGHESLEIKMAQTLLEPSFILCKNQVCFPSVPQV